MGITEIRWHARAGQGAVTAAKVLAEATMAEGGYVQAFPEYGPERMGAPLRAYNRISDAPLTMHCQVTNPNVVIVVDSSLMDALDVTEGTPEDAVFLVNTTHTPEQVAKKINRPVNKVFTVDATQISIDCLGRPIPNTPWPTRILSSPSTPPSTRKPGSSPWKRPARPVSRSSPSSRSRPPPSIRIHLEVGIHSSAIFIGQQKVMWADLGRD